MIFAFFSHKVFYHMQVFGDDALFVDVQETDGGEGSVILLMKVCVYEYLYMCAVCCVLYAACVCCVRVRWRARVFFFVFF